MSTGRQDVDNHPVYRAGDTYRVSGLANLVSFYYRDSLSFPASDDQPTETVTVALANHTQDVCVVHDACWELLRRFFKNVPIPWGRLFDTLRPKVSIRPCLARVLFSRTRRADYIHPKSRQRFQHKKLRARRERTAAVLTKSDVFTVFPLEICYEIVKHLSMPDFYNLRLVSRYMGDLFFYADFWASQFDLRGSRGWLFDLKERPLEERPQGEDWRLLYWSNRLPLMSRQREVWYCCLWIKDMVTMVFPPWTSKSLQPPPKEKDYMWKKLRTEKVHEKIEMPITHFHTFYIPSDLTTLVISMATVRKETFVTGLRFLSKENVVSVGDILPDSPIIPIRGAFDGFEVASCAGGIRALKVVVDKVSSSWFGNVSENTTCNILTLPAQPDILRAAFAVSSFNQNTVT